MRYRDTEHPDKIGAPDLQLFVASIHFLASDTDPRRGWSILGLKRSWLAQSRAYLKLSGLLDRFRAPLLSFSVVELPLALQDALDLRYVPPIMRTHMA